MAATATVSRDADALRFGGVLLRDAIAGLWRQLPASMDGIRAIDLSEVERIDSAGLALIALLMSRCDGAELRGVAPRDIDGRAPAGFAELREAYRLGHGLAFVKD